MGLGKARLGRFNAEGFVVVQRLRDLEYIDQAPGSASSPVRLIHTKHLLLTASEPRVHPLSAAY